MGRGHDEVRRSSAELDWAAGRARLDRSGAAVPLYASKPLYMATRRVMGPIGLGMDMNNAWKRVQ